MKVRLLLGMLLILMLSAFVLQVDEKTTEFIGIIGAAILGLLGAKPMNWLKNKFGVEDGVALLLVYVLSGLVTAAAMALAGQFVAIDLTVEGVIALASIYFAAAQAAYRMLK